MKRSAVHGPGARDLDGERGDGEHRGQHAHSEEYVVGIEAVGVETETLPSYEDGHEERREGRKAIECVGEGQATWSCLSNGSQMTGVRFLSTIANMRIVWPTR